MKKLAALLFLAASTACAQNTVVSATIVDQSGQAYANGTWQVDFFPAPNIPGPYTQQGQPFTQHFSGTLTSNGSFTVTLASSASIVPANSRWTFKVCPNATAPCTSTSQSINGVTLDMSANISAYLPPALNNINPTPNFNTSYTNLSMGPPNKVLDGSAYFNTTTGMPCWWFHGAWECLSTGTSGGPPTGPAGGDLSGTYPNPQVVGLRGVLLPTTGTGFLNWNGTLWSFGTTAVSGIQSINGDTTPAQAISGAGIATVGTVAGNTTITVPAPIYPPAITTINGNTNPIQAIVAGTGISVNSTNGTTTITNTTPTTAPITNLATGSTGGIAIWQTGATCVTNAAISYNICNSTFNIPGNPFRNSFVVVCSPGGIASGTPSLVEAGPVAVNPTNQILVGVMNGTSNGANAAGYAFLSCIAFGT